jgi:predicted nucleic acid-binding protein
VLVYTRDSAQREKQRQAEAWMVALWGSRRGRLSTQVLAEFYVNATQKLRPGLDRETARADVRALSAWQPLDLDGQVFEQAWRIQDRDKLGFWDALIVSAAQVGGCRYLLTEDLQDGQEIAGVRVVNPFRSLPSALI